MRHSLLVGLVVLLSAPPVPAPPSKPISQPSATSGQCATGSIVMGASCVSYAQYCLSMMGTSNGHGVWTGNLNSDGTPSCGCAAGYKVSTRYGTSPCVAVAESVAKAEVVKTVQNSTPVKDTTPQKGGGWWAGFMKWLGL